MPKSGIKNYTGKVLHLDDVLHDYFLNFKTGSGLVAGVLGTVFLTSTIDGCWNGPTARIQLDPVSDTILQENPDFAQQYLGKLSEQAQHEIPIEFGEKQKKNAPVTPSAKKTIPETFNFNAEAPETEEKYRKRADEVFVEPTGRTRRTGGVFTTYSKPQPPGA